MVAVTVQSPTQLRIIDAALSSTTSASLNGGPSPASAADNNVEIDEKSQPEQPTHHLALEVGTSSASKLNPIPGEAVRARRRRPRNVQFNSTVEVHPIPCRRALQPFWTQLFLSRTEMYESQLDILRTVKSIETQFQDVDQDLMLHAMNNPEDSDDTSDFLVLRNENTSSEEDDSSPQFSNSPQTSNTNDDPIRGLEAFIPRDPDKLNRMRMGVHLVLERQRNEEGGAAAITDEWLNDQYRQYARAAAESALHQGISDQRAIPEAMPHESFMIR